MPEALKWDQIGEKIYETGVDHGVLYPQKDGAYPKGVAWSGLITATENPSGAEDNKLYADNIVYLTIKSAEEFGGTIECYTSPDEWDECNGESELFPGVKIGQQSRNTFGFSYRTKIGNDTEGEGHGYKIHLWYGCSASPSEQSYETINDNPEAITFSYEVSSTPVPITGNDPKTGKPLKPISTLTIDSTQIDSEKLKALEKILYGSEEADARLPLPDEIKQILAEG